VAGIPSHVVDLAEKIAQEFEQQQRRATEALHSSLGNSIPLTRLADFVRLFKDLKLDSENSMRQAKLIQRNLMKA
jgi:hypothetical protein